MRISGFTKDNVRLLLFSVVWIGVAGLLVSDGFRLDDALIVVCSTIMVIGGLVALVYAIRDIMRMRRIEKMVFRRVPSKPRDPSLN